MLINRISFAFSLMILSSCGIIYDEFSSPGGYPAVQADRFVKAVTYQQHVDRYRTVSYYLSVISLSAAYDEDSAEDSIRNVVDLLSQLEEMDASIEKCGYQKRDESKTENQSNLETENCPISNNQNAYDFEWMSLKIQRDIEDVAYDLFNSLGIRFNVKDIGSISNLTRLANLIWDMKSQVGTVREAAASYRGMTHVYARTVSLRASELNVDKDNNKICDGLKTSLEDLYRNGKYIASPTIADSYEATENRRLYDILKKTNYCTDQIREMSNENVKNSYWTVHHKNAALHLIKNACENAENLTSKSDELCKDLTTKNTSS